MQANDDIPSEHFGRGYSDGLIPGRLHEPGHWMTSEQKAEYTQGFTVARDFRIDGKREFVFKGKTYTIRGASIDRVADVDPTEDTAPRP